MAWMRLSAYCAQQNESDDAMFLALRRRRDDMNEMNDSERLDAARKLVIKHRKASISLVQRTLQIGYNAAARLLEELEKDGTVSPMNANGIRSVLK